MPYSAVFKDGYRFVTSQKLDELKTKMLVVTCALDAFDLQFTVINQGEVLHLEHSDLH